MATRDPQARQHIHSQHLFLKTMKLLALLSFLPSSVALLAGGWTSSLSSSSVLPFLQRETTVKPTPRVQREYHTWTWKTPNHGSFRINYKVEGPVDGPPILLTHGFGANLNHFRYQFPALVQSGYRVYAMDLVGFGASEKPAHVPYSIDLFTQQMMDFVASRESLDKPWIFAGNSMGGLCSLNAAAKISKSIQPRFDLAAIVLFNSAGGMTGFRYKDVPSWAHPIMGHFQYFILGPKLHGPLVFNTLIQRSTIETVLKQAGIYADTRNVDDDLLDILLQPASDEGATDVFLRVFTGPAGPTRESLLPEIKVPVLALWGEDDGFTPFDDTVKALGQFHAGKDWTLTAMPGAGHCLHDEHPQAVNFEMISFLKKRGLVGTVSA